MKVQSLPLSSLNPCYEDGDELTSMEKSSPIRITLEKLLTFKPILNLISSARAGILVAILLLAIPALSQQFPKAKARLSIEPTSSTTALQNPSENMLSGVVMDEEGRHLIAASILVRGSSRGTVTDFNGQFQIELHSEKDTIVVSYVGYEPQKIAVYPKGKSNLKIVLKTGAYLNEVVVKGWKVTLPYCTLGCGGAVVRRKPSIMPVRRIRKWDSEPEFEIKTFPNPFVSQIQIELYSIQEGDFDLRLVSNTGQVVHQRHLFLSSHQRLEMDLATLNLPAGTYWLQISDGKGQNFKQQLIKINR